MGIKPASRPMITLSELNELLKMKAGGKKLSPVAIVGIRGYYLNTMGKPGQNDRGIYDDAVLVISPTTYTTFNANTDPSAYRKGKGKGLAKGMARLKEGVWKYQLGLHKGQYMALRQAAPVTVIRDGTPDYEDSGMFGINIHRGGIARTSSLGCQTIPPDQWDQFINLVKAELKRHGQKTLDYVLIDSLNSRVDRS